MVCIFYLIVFISLQVYLADSGKFIFEYSKFGKLLTSDRHTAENQMPSGISKNGYTIQAHMRGTARKWSGSNVLLGNYLKHGTQLCYGSFEGFGNVFAVLENVSIDPSRGRGKIGGENISDVINQTEKDEYYKLSKGYFNLECPYSKSLVPSYNFSNKDHLQHWMQAVKFHTSFPIPIGRRIKEPTICVQRYEYAHVYFTILDIYNQLCFSCV